MPSCSATSAGRRSVARSGMAAPSSSAGMFTHLPSGVNRQPWYEHCSVPSLICPADRRARRCGHASANAAMPSPKRASAQPRPPRRTATGAGPTSEDSATGCQNDASAGCALVNSADVMSL